MTLHTTVGRKNRRTKERTQCNRRPKNVLRRAGCLFFDAKIPRYFGEQRAPENKTPTHRIAKWRIVLRPCRHYLQINNKKPHLTERTVIIGGRDSYIFEITSIRQFAIASGVRKVSSFFTKLILPRVCRPNQKKRGFPTLIISHKSVIRPSSTGHLKKIRGPRRTE